MRVITVSQWEWNSILLGGRAHCLTLLFEEHRGFNDIFAALALMEAWCVENIGPMTEQNWTYVGNSFRFEFLDPNHAFAFRLRFCDGYLDIDR